MRTSRRCTNGMARCALATAALLIVGCTGSDGGAMATTSTSTTSSTSTVAVDATVTTLPPSSTSISSTSTTVPTSTIPAVEGLELSAGGLGGARFGAGADGVVDYVTALVGAPTSDSGWVDPFLIGAACPGSEVRFVTWGDLQLFFSDESNAASGLRHFAAFHYGPSLGSVATPYGLTTAEGIGLGSTVKSLRAAYPQGVMAPGDEVLGPRYVIADGLTAFVTETVSAGLVQSFAGGFGCGE